MHAIQPDAVPAPPVPTAELRLRITSGLSPAYLAGALIAAVPAALAHLDAELIHIEADDNGWRVVVPTHGMIEVTDVRTVGAA